MLSHEMHLVSFLHRITVLSAVLLVVCDASGQTWRSLNTPVSVELKCGFFIDDDHAVAVGEDGTIIHSDDGGLQWRGQQDEEQGWFWTAGFKQGGSFVIAAGDNGLLMSSSDYGVTWKAIPTGLPTGSFIFGCQVVDESTFFLAGGEAPSSGVIMKTTDAGANWSKTVLPDMFFLDRVIFRDNQLGFTCGSTITGGGKILKTTDGGTTWKPIYETDEGFVTSIQCPTDQHIYGTVTLLDATGMLLRSTNGGITWGEEDVDDHEMISNFFIDADRGYAGGTGVILVTSNGGIQWNDAGYTGFQNINYVHVTGDKVLAVGTNGVLLESTIPSSVDEPAPVSSLVYPNPATLHVRITSPFHGAQSIAIYDVLGRVVLKKDLGEEVIVERNGLPNGVYHYTITTSAGELATKGSFVFE